MLFEQKCCLTHHLKCQLAKKTNFWYHLSGNVVDILGIHFLPMDKSKIQPYLRGGGTQVKWAAKCMSSHLSLKRLDFWFVYGKKWTSSRSTTTPDRWYWKFFFWPTGTSNDVCGAIVHNSLVKRWMYLKLATIKPSFPEFNMQ